MSHEDLAREAVKQNIELRRQLELVTEALETFRGFIRNPVIRILLVVVLTNVGSSIGTFVAIPWIAAR